MASAIHPIQVERVAAPQSSLQNPNSIVVQRVPVLETVREDSQSTRSMDPTFLEPVLPALVTTPPPATGSSRPADRRVSSRQQPKRQQKKLTRKQVSSKSTSTASRWEEVTTPPDIAKRHVTEYFQHLTKTVDGGRVIAAVERDRTTSSGTLYYHVIVPGVRNAPPKRIPRHLLVKCRTAL
jgi:hypothetical protein